MRQMGWLAAALLAAGLAAAPAFAGEATTAQKEDAMVHAKMDAIGKVWNLDVGKQDDEVFVPLLKKVPRGGIAVTRDQAYGADPLQKLDVYAPKRRSAVLRPVVVYVHGGGLTGGDKDSPGTDGMLNSNVPVYFANHGMVGVNADYRLAPKAVWPNGAQDIAGVIAWLRANSAKYGGDPKQLFIIGHSAGGTILATYLFDQSQQPADGPGIAGAMLLTGAVSVEATCGGRTPYCGTDQSLWTGRAGLTQFDNYKGKRVPMFLITAQYDPASLEAPMIQLLAKMCTADKVCPRYFQGQHMNHLSTSLSLGTADDSLGSQMRDFIAQTVAGKPAS